MSDNSQTTRGCLLEVIACTLEDAVEAEKGGANRLEIISRFDVGGLTPPLDMVREIKEKVSLPLRVMLRESEGYAVSGEAEIEKLCAAAREFNEIGVDGIVLGFLRNGEIDFELLGRILAFAPDLKATFHHAFEDTSNKLEAIEKLKKHPRIDRILAHGGKGIWAEKISCLGDYTVAAHPEIKILAGGGVDMQVISMIRAKTSLTEFHVGRAAQMGGKVDRSQVAMLATVLTENYD